MKDILRLAARANYKGCKSHIYCCEVLCKEASDWLDSMKEARWLAEPLKKRMPGKASPYISCYARLMCKEASDWLDRMKEAPWLAEPPKEEDAWESQPRRILLCEANMQRSL